MLTAAARRKAARIGSSRGIGVLVALAVLLPLSRWTWFAFGPSLRLEQAFADDAYYYALIAQNIAHGKGSTFGGLVPTNGYQPLWEWMLVPLAALADGDAFLRLTYALVAVLFGVAVALMLAIARGLRAGAAGTCAAVYAVTVGLLAGNQYFDGMEIAVLVPAMLALVLVVLRRSPGTRTGLLVGLLALAVGLGRLDALAFPVALGALALRHSDPAVRRTTLVAGAVLGTGMLAYLVGNLLAFGTALPVSGQAKAVGGGTLGFGLLADYLGYGRLAGLPMLLGAQAVVVGVVALALLHRRRVFSARVNLLLRDLLWACLLGQAAQLVYFSVASSYDFWPWYYYYVPLQLFLGALVLVQAVLAVPSVVRRAAAPVPLAALAGIGLLAGVGSVLTDAPYTTTWAAAAPRVAAWLDANTAPGDVVGMGDRAGFVTWLHRRPTLQLEGLVEDAAYLPVLAEQRIAGHMTEVGVRYYVRSDEIVDGRVPDYSRCTEALEPTNGSGPRSEVPVCPRDLVYREVGGDYLWSVWRYGPGR